MALFGTVIIWIGMVCGVLDFLTDYIYYSKDNFYNSSLQNACLVFIFFQPLWLMFIYFIYIASHSEIQSGRERTIKLAASPLYTFLQYFKVLGGLEKVNELFVERLGFSEKFPLLSLENCFKIQILSELCFETFPQMIIQVANNKNMGWESYSSASFFFTIVMFVKDVTILTIWAIKRFIDHQADPPMRPSGLRGLQARRVEKDATFNIQAYLMDPNDEGIDDDGNTTVHQLTKKGEDFEQFEQRIKDNPHLLFMLNKQGLTPLDMTILANDEKRAIFLIEKMKAFTNNCSLKFVKRPHRLDLKFEKSFSLAVQKNNQAIIDAFPAKQVQTAHVSMSQVKDYQKYKSDKRQYSETVTTPLHLACKLSQDEAVRILTEYHGFDINILLNDKNALYELLSTASYQDFNILNYLMKRRKPQINSGARLPLNQAILRGNPFIIKTLLEFGKANMYVKDINGKAAIHVAAAKLDLETFDMLIKKGADPMMPDRVGNTILHIMAYGAIRDIEYDFIKEIIERYQMRLTRNNDNKTALNIIRSFSGKPMAMRGQPNFKKKIWEYFEEKSGEDGSFIDSDKNEGIHEAVIRGSLKEVQKEIDQADMKDGVSLPAIMRVVERRNYEGKTALMLAIEHDRTEIAMHLLASYSQIDLQQKEAKEGNTALHLACLKGNFDVCAKIFADRPNLCLRQNYLGQTAIHIAAAKKNLQLIQLFQEFKQDCLLVKDHLGENPLFMAAREGDSELFKWFSGHIDFYKARGDQNYKGQTIEHVVCLEKRLDFVEVIKPRPDTRDYYGNLPIFYSLMQDDVDMIQSYFKRGREYFHLRNYKFETLFHIAAKHNSLASLKQLVGSIVFVEELFKKDFKGDTPIHIAGKAGSLEVLEYYCSAVSKTFLEIHNDFGFTPKEAVREKVRLIEEKQHQPKKEEKVFLEGEPPEEEEKDYEEEMEGHVDTKLAKLYDVLKFFDKFENYITEEKWRDRFEVTLPVYIDKFGDPNLRVFMEQGTEKTHLPGTAGGVMNTVSPLQNSPPIIQDKI